MCWKSEILNGWVKVMNLWNATGSRKMGLVAVATQILEMTWSGKTLKASSLSVSYLMTLRTDEGSRPLPSSSEVCAWPTHPIPLLYLPFSKSFIWKPQGGKRSTMQREEKVDQVKVRPWVCTIAPGIYQAICSCPPFKWNTKPPWNHRFPLVMGFKCFYPLLEESCGKCAWEIAL